MQNFLDQLNDNLIYVSDVEDGKTLRIYCKVKRLDYYIRGYKTRVLKDINFGNKFVILSIKLPIYYKDKNKKESFVHPLSCCDFRSRKTKRLEEYIIDRGFNSVDEWKNYCKDQILKSSNNGRTM